MLVMDETNYYGCDVGLKNLVNRYYIWWPCYCWVVQEQSCQVKSRILSSSPQDLNENVWQVRWEKDSEK